MVLPWVPATATARRPTITEASAAARCSTRQPAAARLDQLGVVVPDRGRDDDGVDARRRARRRARRARSRRARAAPPATTESLASLPLTGSPRASMIRAMPDMPAPPIPMKCTRPSSSAGTAARRPCRRPCSPPSPSASPAPDAAASSTRSTSRSSASGRPLPAAARPMVASRSASVSSGAACRAPSPAVQVGVVDEQAAAGLDDRRGVERLLAVADRQRDVRRRQPDRGQLGDRVGARPAQHEVGGGVGQLHPVQVGQHDVRRRRPSAPTIDRVRRAGRRAAPGRRPRAGRGAAPEAASLSRRAPCEPPVTSRVGRSASSPNVRARLGPRRRPGRGSRCCAGAGGRRAGRARSGVPGKAVATYGVSRAPSRLASPGRALASCTTIGTRSRRAAR